MAFPGSGEWSYTNYYCKYSFNMVSIGRYIIPRCTHIATASIEVFFSTCHIIWDSQIVLTTCFRDQK